MPNYCEITIIFDSLPEPERKYGVYFPDFIGLISNAHVEGRDETLTRDELLSKAHKNQAAYRLKHRTKYKECLAEMEKEFEKWAAWQGFAKNTVPERLILDEAISMYEREYLAAFLDRKSSIQEALNELNT